MLLFLTLAGLVIYILHKAILEAFQANPFLNSVIIGVMLIGALMALGQMFRLYPEVRWVNGLAKSTEENPFVAPAPSLLAPMAMVLSNHAANQLLSVNTTRSLLDSVGTRLDEGREIVRYIAGLLIFLGLLGTFWGLIQTVGAVGTVIDSLSIGGDAANLFENLKTGLAEPLKGMGLSFSASLFGLSGSLIVGFLDLQAGQAQNVFYNELEDWLSSATADGDQNTGSGMPQLHSQEMTATLNRIASLLEGRSTETGAGVSGEAMKEISDGLRVLSRTIIAEQQLLRGWLETQTERDKDLRALISLLMDREKR
jgi:biopolymer transport protein ExbB/TolQ